jgi:hypothetical protein
MKRIILLLMFAGTLSLGAQSPRAMIRELTGTVEIKPGGTGDWIPAKPGDVLAASTIVSTGFRSTAILDLGNSTIRIRPLTRLSLEELISWDASETIDIGLRTGRVRAEVRPPAWGTTSFTIRTPIATASVRGTVFDIDGSNIRVTEGTVRYAGRVDGRPMLVSAGQSSRVDGDTGGAQNPVLAADTNRALPALSGQSPVPADGTSPASALAAGTSRAPGNLTVEVTLESQ